MTQGRINSKRMKAINTRNVLNIIRREGCVSRRDLAVLTGLTTGTITNIINELLERKYVIETGEGKSEGGRKPILLELNSEAGYAVGLSLDVSSLICVISDFKANILFSKKQKIDVRSGKYVIIDQMIELIEDVINHVNVDRKKILGLGLAVPGPCDYQKGIMINPPNFPGWINVPIKEIFTKRLGMKVYVSKETSCYVLSDYWFGRAAGIDRIFGFMMGEVGIGGALVLKGEIFQEKEGESMDIGHTIVQLDGYSCSCGNRGCLEAHANGHAAVRYAQEMLASGYSSTAKYPASFQDIVDNVNQGDLVSIEAIKKCAYYASVAIGNALSLLSPQMICFGGEFIDKCPIMYDLIVKYLERRDYPASAKASQKSRFTFGEQSGAIGGVALVFDALSKSLFS
ncbi:MAG: ROK family protein [Clostridiales bacterium]|jgi:predicted NBD/HSP70 family sugar kinase|nr:ROK family protein [Clostridiales bacterium]